MDKEKCHTKKQEIDGFCFNQKIEYGKTDKKKLLFCETKILFRFVFDLWNCV